MGEDSRPKTVRLSQIQCAEDLKKALILAYGHDFWLTPPQCQALEQGLLNRDSHFLVCTPTNSGKTLIAVLRIFHQALTGGKRSIYVTPLKAIAEEKRQEFERISSEIRKSTGQIVKIRITTGDYQFSEDFPDSPPPETGDIILCTPERLEILLRNPAYHPWASCITNVVVDEIHLLGEMHRGPNLEVALTRLRLIAPQASIVGLSATVGGIDRLAEWFSDGGKPVTVVESGWRYPPLKITVTYTPDKHLYLKQRVLECLGEPSNSILVFTYRKEDARKLAKEIASCPEMGSLMDEPQNPGELGHLMQKGVAFFHAGLTLQQRSRVAEAHRNRRLRVVAATTSLKMGVNLPTSHVFVRDHAFWGSGNLPVSDLFQMLGRAGRGESPGCGEVLVDDETVGQLYAQQISERVLPELHPQLFREAEGQGWGWKIKRPEDDERWLLPLVLSEIVSKGNACVEEVESFLRSTFSGFVSGFDRNLSLSVMKLQQWRLIQKVEGTEAQYEPRALGKTVALSGIHPRTGAAFGGLLVGLIRLGERTKENDPAREANYLRRLTDLDLLFMVCCGLEVENHLLKVPGKKTIQRIQESIERLDPEEKPLFNLWRSEKDPGWNPSRLLATLKVPVDAQKAGMAEKKFYQIMQTAVLLFRHSRGVPLAKLAEDYQAEEGELEQGLKYCALWLLNALAQICDSRKCYKLDFLMLKALELIEKVQYGSGLAPLLKLEGIGRKSIEKLMSAGFLHIKGLERVSYAELTELGLSEKQSQSILRIAKKTRR